MTLKSKSKKRKEGQEKDRREDKMIEVTSVGNSKSVDKSNLEDLRKLRDSVTFRKDKKELLIKKGFVKKVDFSRSKPEVALECEILSLLSSCCQVESSIMDDFLKFLRTLLKESSLGRESSFRDPLRQDPLPRSNNRLLFSREDISLVRSFKIISLNLRLENPPLDLFLDFLYLEKEDLYALKNEAISFFCGILEYKDISREISQKKLFYVLNNPHLDSIGLISRLITPSTCGWIKIRQILQNIEGCGEKKIQALESCIKWHKYQDQTNFRAIIEVLSKYILQDKTCLGYFGRVLEGNVEAQEYARDTGLLLKICQRYEEEISPEVVYALGSLVEALEANRKILAESRILDQVFLVFKRKSMTHDYDETYTGILRLLRAMTRSILFLRTGLLDYPIIELLFNCLDKQGCPERPILSLLVNLVFEYGNYKKKFISLGGFEKVLKFKEAYPLEVLQIFKNYLYDTHWSSKELFVSATDQDFLNFFFDLYEKTKDVLILETLFNLIRNLVCDDSLELILVSYDGLIPQVFKYLKELDPSVGGPMIQILYTIGNLSANSPPFRDLLFLEDRMDLLKRVVKGRDLELAFVWIIINVSWKDEGYKERVEKLKACGIREFLLKIQASDSVLLDKINTALENIK